MGEFQTDGSTLLREGASLRLVAQNASPPCRPACDTIVERTCSYTREGNTFRLRGRVIVDVHCGGDDPVPVCMIYPAERTTEPLTAGEYTVTDGARSMTFRVPSTMDYRQSCTSPSP